MTAENTFNAYINATFDKWELQTDQLIKALFNGSDDNLALLTTLISNGQLTEGSLNGAYNGDSTSSGEVPLTSDTAKSVTNSYVAEKQMERAFYGYVIPMAWALSSDNVFVIDAGYPCGTDNPLSPTYIDTKTAGDTYVCGADNNMYYLVAALGDEQDCQEYYGGNTYCVYHTFSAPPGLDSLVATTPTQWGNVSKEDIVYG